MAERGRQDEERKQILRHLIDHILITATKERIDATIIWRNRRKTSVFVWRASRRRNLVLELHDQKLTPHEIKEILAAGKTSTGQVAKSLLRADSNDSGSDGSQAGTTSCELFCGPTKGGGAPPARADPSIGLPGTSTSTGSPVPREGRGRPRWLAICSANSATKLSRWTSFIIGSSPKAGPAARATARSPKSLTRKKSGGWASSRIGRPAMSRERWTVLQHISDRPAEEITAQIETSQTAGFRVSA